MSEGSCYCSQTATETPCVPLGLGNMLRVPNAVWVKLGKRTKATHWALWRFLITPAVILSVVGITIMVTVNLTTTGLSPAATAAVSWEGETCQAVRTVNWKQLPHSLTLCVPLDARLPPERLIGLKDSQIVLLSQSGHSRLSFPSDCLLYSLSNCLKTN